jgi:hypothetical protein
MRVATGRIEQKHLNRTGGKNPQWCLLRQFSYAVGEDGAPVRRGSQRTCYVNKTDADEAEARAVIGSTVPVYVDPADPDSASLLIRRGSVADASQMAISILLIVIGGYLLFSYSLGRSREGSEKNRIR